MRWLKFPSMWCTRRKRLKRPGSLGRGKQSELMSRWLNTWWLLNGVVFRKQHKISYIYIHNHIIRFIKYIIVYIFCFVVYNFWDYSTPIVRDVHFFRQKMCIRKVQSTHQTSHGSIIPVASCNRHRGLIPGSIMIRCQEAASCWPIDWNRNQQKHPRISKVCNVSHPVTFRIQQKEA